MNLLARGGSWVMGVGLVLMFTSAMATEFSKTLNADEFAQAGLTKLTPAELQRLNALVKSQHGIDPSERRGAAAAETKEGAGAKSSSLQNGNLLDRLRVVLTPGTDIEYVPVETQLAGRFRGYEPGTILALANGQRWKVTEGSFWSPDRTSDRIRKVVIEPGVLGSFFLRIENGGRPKVKIVGNKL